MKKIYLIVVCLFFLFAVVSCKSTIPTVMSDVNTTKTITQTLHDTVFKIEKDNSMLQALLECQNGKIIIKEIANSQPGRILKPASISIKNNRLKVDCNLDEQKLYAKWKQENTTEIKTVTNTKILEVNKLTFWQQLQIYCFWLVVVISVLTLGYYKIKNYLKTV